MFQRQDCAKLSADGGQNRQYKIHGDGTITFDRKSGVVSQTKMELKVVGDSHGEIRVNAMCRRLGEEDLAVRLREFETEVAGVTDEQERHVEVLSRPQPSPDLVVTTETPLAPGDTLQAFRGGKWSDVKVLEVLDDGRVRVHWVGFGSELDQTVERSRLRLHPDSKTKSKM